MTCLREVPDDLKSENAPRYFAQDNLLPRTEDAFAFASAVQNICGYRKAISDVLRYGDNKEIEQKTYATLFGLVGELSEAALRRVELSLEAMREREERELEAKKATPARKAGV